MTEFGLEGKVDFFIPLFVGTAERRRTMRSIQGCRVEIILWRSF